MLSAAEEGVEDISKTEVGTATKRVRTTQVVVSALLDVD
jgi:hypothetical protein